MNLSIFEYVNRLDTPLLETLLLQNASEKPAKKLTSEVINLVCEVLYKRQEAAALRKKYPRQVLAEMSNEALELLLWEEALSKYPAWQHKELLRDIFEIQEMRAVSDSPFRK